MARRCSVSKVGPLSGHQVSHANNKTKRKFNPNLQRRRIFVPKLQKFVTVRITTRVLRTMDKIGVEETFRKFGISLQDIAA